MAIVADLTPTPIPAGTQNGDVPGTVFAHVTVTTAGGAGTYTFSHNLQWTPTFVMVIAQLTEGTTPTVANSVAGFCSADTTSTKVAFNAAGNNIYHVYYA